MGINGARVVQGGRVEDREDTYVKNTQYDGCEYSKEETARQKPHHGRHRQRRKGTSREITSGTQWFRVAAEQQQKALGQAQNQPMGHVW